ncbi:MAG: M48 family metallopeptidase [Bacteroidales bacterium]|nr:M48 family metallopeptidase [Bacteroidales bacterium]
MNKIKYSFLLFLVSFLAVSCGTKRTIPISGRTQSLLVSDEQILSLSNQEYASYMQGAKKSTNANNTAIVKNVGQRLATAVEQYLTACGMASELGQYQWEFNLIQDSSVNAFCMPGGKIVVYEGMLPVAQDETCLAIVVGHEVAHAVAKHSAEQMSKQIKQQYGTQIAGLVLNQVGVNSQITQLAQLVAQQGFQFRNLKYSRDHEYEADRMGLIIAAMAGYDPQKAIPFWQRMAAENGGVSQSDVMSDHPSDANRIAAMEEYVKEAMTYYKPTTTSTKTTTKTTTKATTTSSATKTSSNTTTKTTTKTISANAFSK